MAKQVEVEQLDQMIKDFENTARTSSMPQVRELAGRMLPLCRDLRSDLALYRKITR